MDSTKRVRPVFAVMITVVGALGVALLRVPGVPSPPVRDAAQPAARQRTAEAFGRVPLYFVENRGQVVGPVHYYVHGRDTSVYFGASGLTFALSRRELLRRASWTPVGFGLSPEPSEKCSAGR